MSLDSARRLAVALIITACRNITVFAWPTIIFIDLVLLVAGARVSVPRFIYFGAMAATCVALADWIRRGVAASQAAAERDRDRMLAAVHDRIDDVRAASRDDLDRSMAWVLRRFDRDG